MADDRTQAATSVRNPIATGAYVPDSTRASQDTPPDTGAGGSQPAPLPDVPGYAVTGELARGGMGRVLAATDLAFGREVAIKVLLPGHTGTDAARRFIREAVITGRLEHPGLAPAHGLGTLADGSPFLAMKLVRGATLADLLKARPTPAHDLPRFVGIFEQIAQAVGYAHSQGVLHRDIKPANVMVGAFGEVQVMDWGIALTRNDEFGMMNDESKTKTDLGWGSVRDSSFTVPGAVMGTPAYMAPEQARGEEVDARADTFALGAVLCVVLTGGAPFRGHSAGEVLSKAAAGAVADAFARLDACGADPELIALAKHCLCPYPAGRPADGTAVAALAAAYRAGVEARLQTAERERTAAEARAAEGRKRRRVQLALAAAVVLMVAGAGAVAVWRVNEDGKARAAAARLEQKAGEDRAASAAAAAGLLDQAEVGLRARDAARAAPLLDQAARPVAAAGATALDTRLTAYRADLAMLRELDRIDELGWAPVGRNTHARERAAGRWAAAFAGYGIVPGKTPPAAAASRVNGAPIRAALLTALDVWHAVAPTAGVQTVLDAADPDPFRAEVRRLLAAQDRPGLEALSDRPEWAGQRASTARAVAARHEVPVVARRAILARVAAGQTGDFALLMDLGVTFPSDTPTDAADRARWFQAAAAARPGSAAAHSNLGIALDDLGNRDGAVAAYREAIRLDPKLAPAHNNLGATLFRLKELDGAAAAYREAIRLDPTYAVPHNGLGYVLLAGGDEAAAVAAFREAIRLDPTDALPHAGLGHALRARRDLDGAAAEYGEAIRLDPAHAAAHFNLGNVHLERRDPAAAVPHFRTAVRLKPADADSHAALGHALDGAGDPAGAEIALREAVRLSPDDPANHNTLGLVLEGRLDLAAAEAEYRKAVRLDPRFHLAHANLGDVYRKQGRHAEAVAAYRAALDVRPTLGYAREGLAFCLRVQRGEVPTAPPPRPVVR